jgi:deoxycytidylate deaminase
MKDRHNKYLKILKKVAQDVTPVGAARVASCIVYKHEIVSFGINSFKTHPIQAKFGRTDHAIHLHAEIDSIKNASRILSPQEFEKSTIYIARMKFTDMHKRRMIQGLSCPCDGCKNAIVAFGIKKAVYTLDDDGYGEM